MHSLRFKITAITIAAILMTILCVFAVSYTTLKKENDRSSVEMMNVIGRDTKKSLEKYTESIEQSMEMVSNISADTLDSVVLAENGAIGRDSEMPGPTKEQTEKLDAYLKEYCAYVQDTFSGFAAHTHGIISYYFCISPEISETQHGFYYARVGKTGFGEQEPLDAGTLDPEDDFHNSWYYAAISRGRPSWVGPFTAFLPDEIWIYSYTIPIYKSGTLIGVIGMDIPVETLVEQVSSIKVYRTGYVCLLDEDGRILYHPEKEFGTGPDYMDIPEDSGLLERDSSGDSLIRFKKNGEEQQMSFCTLTNGMKLVVVAPVNEINASWVRLVRNILIAALAVILVLAVLIMLIMRAVTLPLQQLTAASRRLADSDYEVELDYKGRDEVGALTDAFSRMRDQIRSYIEDLNHQIYSDKLTDLPNMRHFFKLAVEERDRLVQNGESPVMLYFDIIGMKHCNRQYGFESGDRRICEFAEILKAEFGGQAICRFSGDHFAAVSSQEHFEEKLQSVFRKCGKAGGGQGFHVRVGVYPGRIEEVDVSAACDRAKHASDLNRGIYASTVCVYDEKMLKAGEVYRYVINNLDKALSEHWVQVYYQPIIRAANGKVCDEEALSRWIDPVLGFLSPGDFISALEEARLIYKLDLYVLDQILEKLNRQAAAGMYLVPQSLNLSRMDFDSCDIVEEIRRRVDDAGIARSMLTIEITESVIGRDFDFMKKQVGRFRELGFQVWMDDFGSGYSSLDVLQNIRFDLIKFDMRFMDGFDSSEGSRIILTELAKMAIGLGVEMVCEGVEKKTQVDFLKEIGCTKIQGYYYGKPIPFEKILSNHKLGIDMGFENPAETDYYTSIGRINLYDMAVLANENDESLSRYFNTLPMCIMEVNGDQVRYNRCNRSYRDFLERTVGVSYTTEAIPYLEKKGEVGFAFMNAAVRCSREGGRLIVDEKVGQNTTVHTFVRHVAVNPVTGTTAVAAAVLAVIQDGESSRINYAHIAQALSADYINLYYVNLETEQFTQYSSDAVRENLALERHGENFFEASRQDALRYLYKEDQEYFLGSFYKENVRQILDTQGAYTLTYRLMIKEKPVFVNMKAVRMPDDPAHIIIGVNNVDAQMRQKEALDRIQGEQLTYSRVNALTQGYICIYTVDPVTSRYTEYSATTDYARLGIPKEGDDFFAQTRQESMKHIYPEDLSKFQAFFTREKVLEEIEKEGFYTYQYRIILSGEPKYVSIKAALVQEKNGPQIIIGLSNVDAQVRMEQDYEQKLMEARSAAGLDTLTGVKGKAAYENMSEFLSRQIEVGRSVSYAIVLCRVSDLEEINEKKGWDAGDRLIRAVCAEVCDTFKHSPVFRVEGDTFAVLAQGHDYLCVDALALELKNKCEAVRLSVNCGMAKYDENESVASVFARAEQQLSENDSKK